MDLETKKRIAHLEAVNAMAIETIKQIESALKSDRCSLEKIQIAVNWFNKYGCSDK